MIAIVVAIIVIILLIIFFSCRKGKKSENVQHSKPKKKRHGKLKNIKIEKAEGKTQVEWESVPEVDHYVMYYSEEKGFDKSKANKHDPVDENSMVLASDESKGYYFRVTSVQKIDGKMVENELSDEHFLFLDGMEA